MGAFVLFLELGSMLKIYTSQIMMVVLKHALTYLVCTYLKSESQPSLINNTKCGVTVASSREMQHSRDV